MALGNFFKRQLKTVIEWNDQDPSIVFFQFPSKNDEIKNASKVIINPGQACILVYEGKVIDTLIEQGVYDLKTANTPFITNLAKILQSFESEHKMRVYFFRLAELVNQKWGTSSPIKYVDSVYQFPIELGAFGSYSIKVNNADTFFTKIIGSQSCYRADDLRLLIVSRIIPNITSLLATQSYSYQNIDTKLNDLSSNLKSQLQMDCIDLGLKLTDFRVEGTSFNEATIERINRIADSTTDKIAAQEVGLNYVEHEKLKALRDAARNEGGLASAGLQLGAGIELAQSFDINKKESSPNSEDDAINQLRKLKSLVDEGILSQEEFNEKKKQILAKM